MRNLKRALSLALASVMLVGMMVVGTSASYKDVASTDNQEAIEVLQAVGIMVGDDNGNFNPDQLVTRNEMAVILSNLMDYRVATYAGTAPFTDVPAWAEPYVAACYTNGLTSGTSATTYGGSQSVTTVEAALMLMKALGYFQYQSDFADDWQIATVAQGAKIYLFDGVEAAVSEAMTRNDVAQLVLNTLEAGTVEADSSSILNITAPGVSVEAGAVKYNYITSAKSYANTIGHVSATSIGATNTGWIVELGEKLYNGKLEKKDSQDDFGRPASQWVYNSKEVGTYADDVTLVYTGKVKDKELYSAIGSTALTNYGWIVYIDGVPQVKEVKAEDGTITYANTAAKPKKTGTDTWGATGVGVLTEVYVDSEDEIVTVVIVNTYVAEVVKVVENDDDYTVTIRYESAVASSFEKEVDVDEEFAKEDIVLVTVADDEIQTLALAETVSGEVTVVRTNDDYIKLDGVQYNRSKNSANLDGESNTLPKVTADVNIYLDTYGNMIAFEAQDVVNDYLYVKSAIASLDGVQAKVYFVDGTSAKIDVTEYKSSSSAKADDATLSNIKAETIYIYSEDDGEYTLTKVDQVVSGEKVGVITKGSADIDTNNSSKDVVTATNATVFVDVDNNVVYTGYKNVPTMKDATFYVVEEKNAAAVVFITEGSEANDGEGFFYVKSATADQSKSGSNTYYTYTVIVDGVEEDLTTKNFALSADTLYQIDTTDSSENVTAVKNIHSLSADLNASNGNVSFAKDGVLRLTSSTNDLSGAKAKSFTYDDETIFVTITAKKDKGAIVTDGVSIGSAKDIVAQGDATSAEAKSVVYVLRVEDKTDATPLAELVIVVSPYVG